MTSSTSAQPHAPGVQLFPDAPAGAVAPESVRALFGMRCRNWMHAHGVWLWMWLALEVLVPGALLVSVSPSAAGIAAVVGLVAPLVVLWVQWSRATRSFWEGYAAARGLSVRDGGFVSHSVPLLRKGDERKVHRVLEGAIGDGRGEVVQYTYTEVTYDSEGDRDETDYDYTLVCFRLPPEVAARFAGVYLRRNSIGLGGLQDKLAHDRGVSLESSAFNDRYDLRVVDEQDDVALYELFSTIFIDQLSQGEPVEWEQVGDSLVVFAHGHRQKAVELDALCSSAVLVLRRYLEEHR